MKPKDIIMLVLLAALWGASFLFMLVGVPQLGVFMLIFLRVAIAALALLLYARIRGHRPNLMHRWRQYLILGGINAAIPFSLISAAEIHLSASFAAILNATTPLFAALVALVWMKERMTVKKIAGLLLGVVGVTVLVGWDPQQSGPEVLLSALFSLLAAFTYAIGGVYSSRAFRGEEPLDLAIGQQLGAAVLWIPFAAFTIPETMPSLDVILSVLALAVFCTSLGYLLYFALIRNVGPVKTLSVTFLVPVFGVLWGALFLGEPVSPTILIGLTIILLSVGLVANVPLFRRSR